MRHVQVDDRRLTRLMFDIPKGSWCCTRVQLLTFLSFSNECKLVCNGNREFGKPTSRFPDLHNLIEFIKL